MLTETIPPVKRQVPPHPPTSRPKSHAAWSQRSGRLRRVLALLSDGLWHSTRDIMENAVVCAVNSVVHELRENGYTILCRRTDRLWEYRREVKA